jgi:hypothetical protein
MLRVVQGELNDRIEQNNNAWIEQVKTIGAAGPHKSIVVSTEDKLLNMRRGPLVIDEALAQKLQFIQEGRFDQKRGATALKLVGDVIAVDAVEIEKIVEENLFEKYPYSAKEVWTKVSQQVPNAKQSEVWRLIADNSLKGDDRYSKYNFRNRAQEDKFKKTGLVSSVTPVIYNEGAIKFLVNLLKPVVKK